MIIKGNPMGIKTITAQRFLDALVNNSKISSTDRSKAYLIAEENGRVFSESELDNLIRVAYQAYKKNATVKELLEVIKESRTS